jgi:ribosomal protein S18 acetylase RimI-like enzyme
MEDKTHGSSLSRPPRPAIEVSALRPQDREAWEPLARGYKEFYKTEVPDEGYAATWQRLMDGREIWGLGARINGKLVGIAHYFFHARVWADDLCYLQDLFVDKEYRGLGAARALIDHIADLARQRGASRLYWHTRESNAQARRLYDRVATFDGFIRYDYTLK